MNTGNEGGIFRRQVTSRVCPHHLPELSRDLWFNPIQACPIQVWQPVCSLVRGLGTCHPLPVVCGLGHPHLSPLATEPYPPAPTGPCLPLCLAALVLGAVCDAPFFTTASGQDITGVASSHHSNQHTVSSTYSLTRDVQSTLCLDLLIVCRFSNRGY